MLILCDPIFTSIEFLDLAQTHVTNRISNRNYNCNTEIRNEISHLAVSKSVSGASSYASSLETSSSARALTTNKSMSSHKETLLTLAIDAALIGLGQQRIMPPGNISYTHPSITIISISWKGN